MTFKGFTNDDFKAMQLPGLDNRMEAIRQNIQPKFQTLGDELTSFLEKELAVPMYLHIAKHARRSVNPPDSTWLAIGHDKRGYKKHPHFQVGLYDEYLFVWLAFIYENEERTFIADNYLKSEADFLALPADFSISPDHTERKTFPLEQAALEKTLHRFRDVKKGEFLIGKIYQPTDKKIHSGSACTEEIKSVLTKLLPFYKDASQ